MKSKTYNEWKKETLSYLDRVFAFTYANEYELKLHYNNKLTYKEAAKKIVDDEKKFKEDVRKGKYDD